MRLLRLKVNIVVSIRQINSVFSLRLTEILEIIFHRLKKLKIYCEKPFCYLSSCFDHSVLLFWL